jgi:hypothetical protein
MTRSPASDPARLPRLPRRLSTRNGTILLPRRLDDHHIDLMDDTTPYSLYRPDQGILRSRVPPDKA